MSMPYTIIIVLRGAAPMDVDKRRIDERGLHLDVRDAVIIFVGGRLDHHQKDQAYKFDHAT
jgi:hypothetical protein